MLLERNSRKLLFQVEFLDPSRLFFLVKGINSNLSLLNFVFVPHTFSDNYHRERKIKKKYFLFIFLMQFYTIIEFKSIFKTGDK